MTSDAGWRVNDHEHDTFAAAVACSRCHMQPRVFPPELPDHERRRAVGMVLHTIYVVHKLKDMMLSNAQRDKQQRELDRLYDFIFIWTGVRP